MELVSEELSACRICLATNIKLYSISDGLDDKFVELMGVAFSEDDGLPQQLCPYCRALLLRCSELRARCRRSQQLLAQVLQTQPCLSTNDILTIDRDFHKLALNLEQLNVYNFDSHEKKVKHLQENSQHEDSVHERDLLQIKREFIVPLLEANADNTDITYKVDPKEKITSKVELIKPSLIFEIDGLNMGRIQIKTVEPKSEKLENMRQEYKIQTAEKEAKKKKKEAQRVSNLLKIVSGNKRKALARQQAAKNKSNFDPTEFENQNECKIDILTMQEQLDEIAARKLSQNYLVPEFKCDFCGKGFEFEQTFNNHMAKHDPSVGKFKCEVCHIYFRRGNLRQRHVDCHKTKFTCNICSFVSRSRHAARTHFLMHTGKVYECKHCDATFTKCTSYLGHVRINHPARDAACDVCGDSFISAVGLQHHKARAHKKLQLTQLKYECVTCGVQFASMDAVHRHTDGQGLCDATMKACAECGEAFSNEELLKTHTDEKHLPVQYWCEECDQTFLSEASYDTHHQRIHLKMKGPAYGRTREMNRQYYQKLRERRKKKAPVVCEKCGAKLTSKTALERHQRGQCWRERKKSSYKCLYCDKSCTTRPGLQYHMRTHTGERPFQCQLCPLAFAQQTNYARHCRVVHMNKRDSFPCELCHKAFTTRYSVQLHVRTVHEKLPWPKRVRRRRPAQADQ